MGSQYHGVIKAGGREGDVCGKEIVAEAESDTSCCEGKGGKERGYPASALYRIHGYVLSKKYGKKRGNYCNYQAVYYRREE